MKSSNVTAWQPVGAAHKQNKNKGLGCPTLTYEGIESKAEIPRLSNRRRPKENAAAVGSSYGVKKEKRLFSTLILNNSRFLIIATSRNHVFAGSLA